MTFLDWLFSDMYRLIFIIAGLLVLPIVAPPLFAFLLSSFEKSRTMVGYAFPVRHPEHAYQVTALDKFRHPADEERTQIALYNQQAEAARLTAEATKKTAEALLKTAIAQGDIAYGTITDPYLVSNKQTQEAIRKGVSITANEEMVKKDFEERLAVEMQEAKGKITWKENDAKLKLDWEGVQRLADDTYHLLSLRKVQKRKLISKRARLLANRDIGHNEKEALLAEFDRDIEFEGAEIDRMEQGIRDKGTGAKLRKGDEADYSPTGS